MTVPVTKIFSIPIFLSFFGTNISCMTLDAQQSKRNCLDFQECSGLNLLQAGTLSATPEKNEEDESYIFEVLNPREAQDGITVVIQAQRQCRAFRSTVDLYKHNNPALFWTNIGLLAGGGGLAGFGATQGGSTGTILLGAGGALALYGLVDTSAHFFNKNLTKDRIENGPYIACGEFGPLTDSGRVEALFTSLSPQAPIRVATPREEGRFLLEPFVMGFSILENPQAPELTLRGYQNNIHQDMKLTTPTPPKRIWLCEAMNRISAIQVAPEPVDWKIYFELDINQAPAALPWTYPDGQSILTAHEDVLKLCPANDRNHLATIANSVIQEDPTSYPTFADALDEIIGQDLYRPDPKARYSTRKRPKRTPPKEKTVKKTPKKRKAPKAGPKYDDGKAPFGRYRCRKRSRIANLYIQRDGSFSLDVELERGYAMGICGSKRCEVQNSSGSATDFINSASMIYISKVGRTLFINNKTQCDKIR
jgi:hypothetical protein